MEHRVRIIDPVDGDHRVGECDGFFTVRATVTGVRPSERVFAYVGLYDDAGQHSKRVDLVEPPRQFPPPLYIFRPDDLFCHPNWVKIVVEILDIHSREIKDRDVIRVKMRCRTCAKPPVHPVPPAAPPAPGAQGAPAGAAPGGPGNAPSAACAGEAGPASGGAGDGPGAASQGPGPAPGEPVLRAASIESFGRPYNGPFIHIETPTDGATDVSGGTHSFKASGSCTTTIVNLLQAKLSVSGQPDLPASSGPTPADAGYLWTFQFNDVPAAYQTYVLLTVSKSGGMPVNAHENFTVS